jgi:acetyl esterase/lipase
MFHSLIRLRWLVWAVILAATAGVGWEPAESIARSPDDSLTVERDHPDRNHSRRPPRLDVYLPRRDDRPQVTGRPAILLVHGGSWIGGPKSSYHADPWRNAVRLTEHGMVVVAVDYLLGRPERPSWPEALWDLRESIRWVHHHAARYGIDPERIAVLGQSSGAHLAMLLGTEDVSPGAGESDSRVQAVISFYGPTDLASLAKFRRSQRDPIFNLLGRTTPRDRAAREDAASPISRVSPSTVPMLLFHGSDDRWVPPDQAREMAESLERAGVFNRLVIVEGARHGFEMIVASPKQIDLIPEILAFLDRVWNASPTIATPLRAFPLSEHR